LVRGHPFRTPPQLQHPLQATCEAMYFPYKFGVQVHRKICRINTTSYPTITARCRYSCIENLVVLRSLPSRTFLPISVSPSCAPCVPILFNGCFLLIPMTNSNHPSNALPVYKHLRLAKASLSSQAGYTARAHLERDLKARERRDKKQRPAISKHIPEIEEEIQVPATPEQQYPPPSTAPARLAGESGGGRGKRKRKMTEAYRKARQQGLL
jgi:hypothetical protein